MLYKDIDFLEFSKWFYYDPSSPSGLRWLIDCALRGKKHKNFRNKGDIALKVVYYI